MNKEVTEKIQKELFANQDLKYKDFQAKLTPSTSAECIIGVRNPVVKKIAKEVIKNHQEDEFTNALPHKYYEENNLHSYIISECKDYNKAVKLLDSFLPHVDNWATCDIITPKVFKKNLESLLQEIHKWIKSKHTYTIRFGIKILMNFYLDDAFKTEYLDIPLSVKSDEYYVRMMIAWYYATALAKQYDEAVKIIEQKKLDRWIHNKTIQKAVESFRVGEKEKEYLRSLRIK